ncbi:IPT/TIG domain-containing protein [Rudaea cellulosilytica]|uniref:IPT/TIG domain-containing protein n=1 Tax=Rudaea cellulosilytica TaxID=540746 RepID=UPI0003737B44|nr:IPT/TIG domain-containing protein [Rudaea cellulosilytica]
MGLRKGCAVAARATFGVLFVLLSGKGLAQTTDTIVNWASAAQGGLAVTSKTSNAYPASSLNDGDRVGVTFGHGGGWLGKTNGSTPDWAQIRFAQARTINTVTVYSPQDNLATASEPNEVQTFTQVGAVGFDVQVQAGSDWTTVAHVTGNKLIKRTVSFVPVKTTAIRVVGTAGTKTGIGIVEIEAWGAAGIDNVAAASAHAVASASSSYGPNFSASSLNDGVTNGTNWGLAENGGWANSSDDAFPNSAEIAFPAMQVVNAVTLWTLQDNYAAASAADDSTAFTQYGVTDFDVQVLTDAWVTVASVTGNNLVKRTVTFPPTAASGIRVVNNAGLNGYARIVELQAWGVPATGVVRLTGMEPRSGQAGDTVTLYGENFSIVPQANVVTFNGVAANVLRATSGVLQVTVPKGATTGTVGVSTNGWTSTTGVPFTVNSGTQSTNGTSSGGQSATSVRPPQAMLNGGGPTVTSFSPASGVSGTTVTITGTGFSTTPSANTVYFGSPTSGAANVTAATATTLTVTAPSDGNIGLIYVTVGGVQASSAGVYEYPPVINSFTPTSRSVGGSILISGQYFNFVHSATFGGGAVQNSVDVSGQTVQAIVPAGAVNGQISLRSSTGLVSNLSSQSLTVVTATPAITGISPSSGLVGAAVTITGTNFNSTPANNTVKFNGTVATVTAATTTSLTATVPTGATTGAVSVTVNGLTATGPTFTVKLPAPTISSFTPTSASRFSTMVIGGTNFSPTAGNNQVYFADSSGNPTIVATVNSATTNSLTVTVPSNAFTGYVLVAVTGAVASVTSNFPFIVTVPTPTITGFSPQIGPVGTSVTITGTNFDGTTLANNGVTFNGTSAAVTTATSSSLTVTVPSGATSGKIAVTVSSSQSGIASQMATSSSDYTVGNPPIAITGFSPQSGPYGTLVTVSGISFGNSQGIGNLRLNGLIIPPTTWSDTAVTFTVPGGTTDGPITVVNGAAQGATTTTPFTITNPTPSITGFTPTYGIPGDTITISGSNFSPNGAGNIVKFNGVTASVVSANSTSINALVPSGATNGTLSVTVNGKTGTSGTPFTVIPVPAITGVTPASGPMNSIISIDGSNFDPVAANNVVTINDVQQNVLYASATKLRIRIAISTQTGPIKITRIEQRNPSVTGPTFTVTAPPVISKITPVSSPTATQVTIYGLNFDSASTSANVVTFNGVAAAVTRATTTELDVWVPSQATTGQVVITNQYGQSNASPVDNYAATWAGATASASSTVNANFSSDTVIDGDIAGGAWGHGGGWNDATAYAFPDWIQVNFSAAKRINDVIVYTLGDNYPSGIDPTDQTTFANYGATAFDVQALQDSTWVTVASVTGNNRVKRRVVFMPVTTTAIRVVVNGSVDSQYSRLVEVESHYDPSNFIVGPLPQAHITSFTPTQGGPGTQVTINGEYFGDNPAAFGNVGFFNGQSGGQAAQIVSWSDLQIVASVPIGAKNGPITVVTPSAGVATSTSSFHYIPPPVTIDSNGLSPLHGRVYFTTLTITGSGFSPVAGDNTVTFSGAAPVNVLQASYNWLTVQVPVGAQTGPVTVAVTIDGVTQTATSSSSFTVDTTQPLDSRFQGQSPFGSNTVINPTMYPPGTNLTATVVMQNRGLTTWTSAQNIYLAETDGQSWAGGNRVNLPASASIPIGGTATFMFPVQVPATPGIYTVRWQMAQDTGTRTLFGDEASAVVYVGPPLPDAPACVIQTSPSSTPAIGAASIRWNAATTGTPVASYRVAISEDGQNWNVDTSQGSSAGTTSATFNPTDGVGHYYAVSACEATPYACTAYVVARNQVSGCSPNPPNKPISLTATPPSGGSNVIGLTWVPDSSGPAATYFMLQVANSASGPWTLVNGHLPLTPTSTSYTAPGNGTYYFEIAACNSNGECSTYTQSTAVTIGGTSPTCAGLSVSPTSVRFNVAGTSQQITVNAPSGCVWTISSTATSWLGFSPSGGTGSGTGAQVTLTPNGANTTSSAYTGVLSIGGNGVTVTVAVSQDGTATSGGTLSLPPAATSINDAVTHDPTVGTMAGQASTDGGAAQYHVPIVVPPGRAGMQPDLALVYNSRSGNGVMGMGWTISGLSSIHRCPQTPEQDGQTLGVAYAATDRLCLDGQRLVKVAGTYGKNGAEYRTEVDSYSRITQVNGDIDGSDAACFRVEQKNGRILHYGGVTSGTSCSTASGALSRVKPTGAPAALSWLVEKIEDRVGNNQKYAYTDNGNSEVLLSKVEYTGYGTTSGDRTVTFAYEPRNCDEITLPCGAAGVKDTSSSYLAGGLTMQTQALQSITTAVSGTTVRTYTPVYAASSYNQRLMMMRLTECAGSICHSPTQFTYSNGTPNFSLNAMANVGNVLPTGLQAWSFASIGDLDGDGTPEYMVLGSNSTDSQTSSFLAKVAANGQITAVDMTGTPFYRDLALYKIARGDIDGSGRTDFSILPAYTIDSNGVVSATPGMLQLGVWAGTTGAALSAGSTPLATFNSTFQTITTNVPVDSNSEVFFQDMNGDGKLDIVVVDSNRCVWVYLNTLTGSLASATSPVSFQKQLASLFCLTSVNGGGGTNDITTQAIDHIADFDGDGIPDIFITDSNLSSGASNFVGVYRTALSGTGTSATVSATLTACAAMGLTQLNDCALTISKHATGVTRWMDVNGDGLEDLVMAKPSEWGGDHSDQWIIRLNRGGGTFADPIYTGDSTGLTDKTYNGSYRYLNKLSPVDIDGDGKPDIVYPSSFALKMCTVAIVGPLNNSECPSVNPTGASIPVGPPTEAAGPVQCLALACPEDPGSGVNLPPNDNAPDYPYAWEGRVAAGLYTSNTFGGAQADHSAYHLDMLKFVQSDSTTFTVQRVPTSLVSGVNNTRDSSVSNDMGGTGLETVPALLGCSGKPLVINNQGTNTYYAVCDVVDGDFGPQYLPDGANGANGTPTSNFQPNPKSASTASGISSTVTLYANFNQGASLPGQAPRSSLPSGLNGGCSSYAPLPGLMYSATNGLGDTAVWDFDTLAEAFLCTRDGVAEYQVDGTYIDSRHYYFSSSMPVVSTMLQSNGIGSSTGSRSAIYSYGDAMYNHYGRGFQGFRTITAENVSSDATRRLQTTTTFNQKFPLVGRIQQVNTQSAPSANLGSHTVHSEINTYTCNLTNRQDCTQIVGDNLVVPTGNTVYQVLLDNQTAAEFDLTTGNQSSHTATVNAATTTGGLSGWDGYGNLLIQTVTRYDDASGGQFVSSHVTTTANTYDSTNVSNWWINKLSQNSVTVSMSYVAGVTPPTGTDLSSKTVATQFSWNADRTPATKTVQPGVANQQSTTTYSYPASSYGLPTQVVVNAPDLAAALSPTRTTSYTYTKSGSTAEADGYFVYTKTLDPNGLSQTVTTQVQPRDGQIIQAKDPNGILTSTVYDVFGRATQITHQTPSTASPPNANIEPPINIALTNCAGGCAGVGSDGNEANVAYRAVSAQLGYPTKVAWFDVLGRKVKEAQAGFSGTTNGVTPALQYSFSATLTKYDENGTVSMQGTPYYVGVDTPNYTELGYDALNRVTAKSSPAACGGTMDTTYAYKGRQTNITVSANACTDGSPTNPTIYMSRSTNALGQLMQTIDANGNSNFTNGKTTRYWTEPQGHVAAIKDVEGNVTKASYNALGQRTQSIDPDQGTWNFTYDAFGEQLTQTDARSVVTTINGRDALGRVTQQQQVSLPSSAGLDPQNLLDTWTYDPVNGIGQVNTITRQRGTSATLTLNPTTWSETYGYDSATRPTSTTTTINEPGSTLNLASSTTYDGTYGRVDTQTYPALPTGGAGLSVKHTYTAYGQLDALSNATTSYVYWTAQAQNAWNHVTAEQYPGVITGSHADYAVTGQAYTLNWSGSAIDALLYTYDAFGNLATQQRTVGSSTNTETYSYDSLQRLTSTNRANGGLVGYSYTDSGNIHSKTDNGTANYTYAGAGSGCGPHAATSANGLSYGCDANGNVISGAISATYDADNHPTSIGRGTGSMQWTYSTNASMTTEVSSRGIRYFGPNGYEQVGTGTGATQVHELGPVIVSRTNGVDSISVVLRDRLGSTINVLDNNTPTTRMYDAFGKARNGDMSDRAGGTLNLGDTIHGFTKHDHADDVQLIHMGGRVYDYQLGRFLQVDPFIANTTGSQALNPYSYVGNNPLSGKDPTGYNVEDHCMGDALCQAASDRTFLAGEIGKLRGSLTYGGAPAGTGPKSNGNDQDSDVNGNLKSNKQLPIVTVGAIREMVANGKKVAMEERDEAESEANTPMGQRARARGESYLGELLKEALAKQALNQAKRADPNLRVEDTIGEGGQANNPIDQMDVLRAREQATINNLRRTASELTPEELEEYANKPVNDTGLSAAARAWDKHDTSRPGGTFPPLTGGVMHKNAVAGSFVSYVIRSDDAVRTELTRGGVDFRLPSGAGVRFDANGAVGFLDPQNQKP